MQNLSTYSHASLPPKRWQFVAFSWEAWRMELVVLYVCFQQQSALINAITDINKYQILDINIGPILALQ